MKKTNTTKSTIVNSNDVVIKSKDNRKVNTVSDNAREKVKNINKLSLAMSSLKKASEQCENATREKAKIFFAIKSNKLYEKDAKNFKEFIEIVHGGNLYGVTYTQASALANMYEFVWSIKELEKFNSNTASALATYCKKDATKVVNAVKKGKISEKDSKEKIRETLKSEFGSKCKTVKEGVSAKAENDELKTALAMVGHFIKKNATKGGDIENAWNVILEYCEQ